MYYGKDSGRNNSLSSIIMLAMSALAIVITVILWFYGIYFFFLFLPITFSLPWSIKKMRLRKARKQWNVEDLR
jgi:dolichyl-phosphate-mannose--protein O-mannosyl transferase